MLVANGAGNWAATSEAFRRSVDDHGVPMAVEKVEWCHGYRRILVDHIDFANVRTAGRCLAGRVRALRHENPDLTICLVGHSAGAATVLTAADLLPPDTVDRILLMAAATSSEYDLRPALRSSRCGIDVFYSSKDWWCLKLATGILGTTDRRWCAPAGRVGFRPLVSGPEDGLLYEKLRQYPWHPGLEWTGNTGGHFGSYQAGYLDNFVLPLLIASDRSRFQEGPSAAVISGGR